MKNTSKNYVIISKVQLKPTDTITNSQVYSLSSNYNIVTSKLLCIFIFWFLGSYNSIYIFSKDIKTFYASTVFTSLEKYRYLQTYKNMTSIEYK